MRKRILSLLLCCVMLLGLMPVTAFADGEGSENTQNETICRYCFSCKNTATKKLLVIREIPFMERAIRCIL